VQPPSQPEPQPLEQLSVQPFLQPVQPPEQPVQPPKQPLPQLVQVLAQFPVQVVPQPVHELLPLGSPPLPKQPPKHNPTQAPLQSFTLAVSLLPFQISEVSFNFFSPSLGLPAAAGTVPVIFDGKLI
jgi:hypothetical protein